MKPRETTDISGELLGEPFRLDDRIERAKQILKLQGLRLWRGDLAEMRDDWPRKSEQPMQSPAVNLGEEFHQAAVALRLRDALEQLQPPCRDVLHLHFFEGLSAAQVAVEKS